MKGARGRKETNLLFFSFLTRASSVLAALGLKETETTVTQATPA